MFGGITFFIFLAIVLSIYFILLFMLNRSKYYVDDRESQRRINRQNASDNHHWGHWKEHL